MGDMMGEVALDILTNPPKPAGLPFPDAKYDASDPVDLSSITRVSRDYNGIKPNPASPKFKIAVMQIYVRGQPFGGSDKSANGHRYDVVPFANGMINAGMSCQIIHCESARRRTRLCAARRRRLTLAHAALWRWQTCTRSTTSSWRCAGSLTR